MRRGADLEVIVELDFMDAAHGVKRDLEVARREHCDTCDGKGSRPAPADEFVACERCSGLGYRAHPPSPALLRLLDLPERNSRPTPVDDGEAVDARAPIALLIGLATLATALGLWLLR